MSKHVTGFDHDEEGMEALQIEARQALLKDEYFMNAVAFFVYDGAGTRAFVLQVCTYPAKERRRVLLASEKGATLEQVLVDRELDETLKIERQLLDETLDILGQLIFFELEFDVALDLFVQRAFHV